MGYLRLIRIIGRSSLTSILLLNFVLSPGCKDDSEVKTKVDTQESIWDSSFGTIFKASINKWDSGMVGNTEVFIFKDTIRMLYSGSPDAPFEGVASIGYAWSLDGLNWNRLAEPVMTTNEGEWDYPNMTTPSVYVDGDSIRMWFGGGKINSTGMNIGYAVSTDCINWINKQWLNSLTGTSSWNEGGVLPGPVIKEDGVFKMWFSGGVNPLGQPPEDSKWSTGYATSIDGINWDVNTEPVLAHGSGTDSDRNWVLAGSVHKTNSVYNMWYSGGFKFDRFPAVSIRLATSDDGIIWTKDEGNPYIISSGGEKSDALYFPCVVVINGETKMYYDAWHPGPSVHIAKRNDNN